MCKKRFLTVLVLLAVTLALSACNRIKGSGNLVSESRQVSNFERIELSGSGQVILTQSGNESLTVETDDNVMKYVQTKVDGGTLKLGFKSGVNVIEPTRLVFTVSVDNLSGVTVSGSGAFTADALASDRLEVMVSGSGSVQIDNLTTSQVKAKISGSGKVNLTGEVTTQDITISGSGGYLTGDICSESVTVSVSGSGNATVCATSTLNSDISGSGSVNYYGQPSINTSSSGSGTLNSLGEK